MPLSAIIQLQALQDGQLDQFTGRGVHGFWFRHWHAVDPAVGDELHASSQEAPFTLSPLTGLPRPRKGVVELPAGYPAWFRATVLSESLEKPFLEKWLGNLDPGVEIEIPGARQEGGQEVPGLRWKVSGHTLDPNMHPLAGQARYDELTRSYLMSANPPRQWHLEFLTPTCFHGKLAHLPFPLPDSLVNSWLRRWQAFASLALPEEELLTWARTNLAVSAFNMHSLPAREGERLRVGGVGKLSLRALDMPPYLRAVLDLLTHYAFYCGSGAHTSQGMGQTHLLTRGVE